jgi:hypothetical protein
VVSKLGQRLNQGEAERQAHVHNAAVPPYQMGPVENPLPKIREDFRHEEWVTAGPGMPISSGLQSAGCGKAAMASAE